MGRKSQRKMTGLTFQERKERAKKRNFRYRIRSYTHIFRRNKNSGIANNSRQGIPTRLPSIFSNRGK